MLYSEVDVIIIPKESGWIEFFAPNSETNVIPLEQSDLYLEDWIGVKYLDDNNRLHR
jgi:palmitoyl-protein thioesterase